jgi:hypothetical protein
MGGKVRKAVSSASSIAYEERKEEEERRRGHWRTINWPMPMPRFWATTEAAAEQQHFPPHFPQAATILDNLAVWFLFVGILRVFCVWMMANPKMRRSRKLFQALSHAVTKCIVLLKGGGANGWSE